MTAKPIIDIMFGLDGLQDVDEVRRFSRRLVTMIWARPACVPDCIFAAGGELDFNVAVVTRGGTIWVANLALGDYLRISPKANQWCGECLVEPPKVPL
jgi:GrpB-like predicted nucleotidyltransferase (UPF0157 family)